MNVPLASGSAEPLPEHPPPDRRTTHRLAIPDLMRALPDFDDARFTTAALYGGTTRVNGFALRAGQGLPEHRVSEEAFLLVTEGAARVTVGDDAHHLGAGGGIVLPGRVPHALEATEDARIVLVRVR